ncbi:MFS transporter [Pelomyxa schiedti]|nr:MFS transporter [Pelomyxa schiedti]
MDVACKVVGFPFKARVRAAWIVVFGIAIDFGLYDSMVPLMPIYQSMMELSQTQVGVFFGIYSLVALVVSFPVGILSDKVGHLKLWLVGSGFLLTFSSLMFAFANSYGVLLGARCLQGFSSSISWTVAIAYMAIPYKESFAAVFGIASAACLVGSLILPAVTGWLYMVQDDVFLPCITIAGVCALSCLLDFTLPSFSSSPSMSPTSATAPRVPVNVDESYADSTYGSALLATEKPPAAKQLPMKVLLHSSGLWCVYCSNCLLSLHLGFEYICFPLYMSDVLHLSSGFVGSIFAVSVLLDIIVSALLGPLMDKIPRSKLVVMLISGWIAASLPLLTLVCTNKWVFSALYVIQTTALQICVLPEITLFFRIYLKLCGTSPSSSETESTTKFDDATSYGKAFGAFNSSFYLGLALSTALSPLWEVIGSFYMFCITGSLVFSALVVTSTKYYCSIFKQET